MKRKLILILCLALVTLMANAAKANSTPVVVAQPDGTKLTIVLHGDEHFSWVTTLNGTLLTRSAKGYYVAKVNEVGELEPSNILAHENNLQTTAERQLIKMQNRQLFFKSANKKLTAARRKVNGIGSMTPKYFPHEGSPKVLTILVEFSDTTFTLPNPKKSFNQYLNAEGQMEDFGGHEKLNYGSVRKYFTDMSGGKFTPQFDVLGPVKLKKPQTYYGKDGSIRKDVLIDDLIREACTAVADSVNFADYDSNKDGVADLVYVIYAGYSQACGGNVDTDIWPKSSWLGSEFKIDNVTIKRYGVSNELNYTRNAKTARGQHIVAINGIGLFCHEFSHTMGLPDFYPINETARVDNQAMEFWDLMDGGEYTKGGYVPTPYTPWEREVMGWTKVETLGETPKKVEMQHDMAYKITSEHPDEYLIVHNIQDKDWYTGVYKKIGHGLLVYRIDYELPYVNMGDRVNDVVGKPGMTIVPADGLLVSSYNPAYRGKPYLAHHAGDPFPGTSNVDSLISVQLNHSTLNKPLYNIKEDIDAKVVSFDYLKKMTPSAISSTAITNQTAEEANKIYTLNGVFVGTDINKLSHGVYIQNKKKIIK